MDLSPLIDTALDRTVAPGFSRIGWEVRKRLPSWPDDPAPNSLKGRQAIVTGATSGLGTATAAGFARLGARVHFVVRDTDKGERVADELRAQVPGAEIVVWRCDVSDLDSVAAFTEAFLAAESALHVIVHNAGALPPERRTSPQGHELTQALHVLGPIAMTEQLLPALAASSDPATGDDARVIFVTSGGMYTQALRDDDPEYLRGDYSGTVAYARSKRVQIELLPELNQRWISHGVRVYATHPGWADTPGVTESLPTFRKVVGPFLRDADSGADTTVWLAAIEPAPPGGGLWHDRRDRPTHMRNKTKPQPHQVARIWEWVRDAVKLPATD